MKYFHFKKTQEAELEQKWDRKKVKPVLRCSICNGEQVAGFKDLATGHFEEVMLIRSDADLQKFCVDYGIDESIEKEY